MTAVNSKADSTALAAALGNWTITAGKAVSSTPMSFQDNTTPEVTLAQLATGSGADQKVAVTVNDTTTGVLDTKLTAGDGLKKTVINPAGNESMDLDIDIADTAVFVKTSSGAGDENKVPVLGAIGQIAEGMIPVLTAAKVPDQVFTSTISNQVTSSNNNTNTGAAILCTKSQTL